MTEDHVIQLFKCLSDKSRLQILKNLIKEPMYVELLAERLELSPSTISFHLKKLIDVGLATSYRDQYYVVYSINEKLLESTILELVKIDSNEQDAQIGREENYRNKILKSFFLMGKLTTIPVQNEKRKIVLLEIAKAFESGKQYTEREVNIIIADYYDDFCTLRRYMVTEGIFERENSIYTKK